MDTNKGLDAHKEASMYSHEDATWDAIETGMWAPPRNEETTPCPFCGIKLADDELCCCNEALEAQYAEV